MAIEVTLGGLDAAMQDLVALPALAEAASREAVDQLGRELRAEAIRMTTEKYALSAADLDPYVVMRSAVSAADGATVTLQARAIPISVFHPTVRMKMFTVRSRSGSTYTRKLPTVLIKRSARGSNRTLEGYFPMHQRTSGALASGDGVRRRIAGKLIARTIRGKQYDGEALTGVRYYTFPRIFLQRIEPRLKAYAGQQARVALAAAFRENFKGQRVLRGPK